MRMFRFPSLSRSWALGVLAVSVSLLWTGFAAAERLPQPQLDRSDVSPPTVLKIQTRRQVTLPPARLDLQDIRQGSPASLPNRMPVTQGPGIVGLDMLIHSQRYPVVQYVFPHTPADRQGIRAGDTLLAVNGVQLLGKSRAQVDAMIPDVPGERVSFVIARDGRLHEVTLTVMALSEVAQQSRSALSAWMND